MKYEQYGFEWLNGYGEARLKPSTVKGYNHYLHNYINPYMGPFELSELTTYQVQMWIYDLQNKGSVKEHGRLNSKTVIQAYRIFSRSLKSACRMGLLQQNPCFGVELPRRKKCAYVWLESASEIQNFLSAFEGTRFYLPVLVTLALGLRRSELLGLRWGDIDFKKGTVNISRSIIRDRDSTIRIDDLKNISSHRVILMPEFLIGALVSIGPPEAENDEYLFGCSDGSPMNPDTFSSAYCSFRNAHGLPRVRFHDLRHPYVKLTTNNICIPYTLKSLTLYAISMRFWGNTYTFSISKSTMELVRPSA